MARLRLRDRLEHILVAIKAIEDYTRSMDEDAFLADPLRIDAVERNLGYRGYQFQQCMDDKGSL